MAAMPSPVRSSPGPVFQPFRFIAVGDEDRQTLRMTLEPGSQVLQPARLYWSRIALCRANSLLALRRKPLL